MLTYADVQPEMLLALLTINRQTVRLITFESGDGSLQDLFFLVYDTNEGTLSQEVTC